MSRVQFQIEAECPRTRARAGLLSTPHGVVETPVFMPVGTQATVKGVPQRDLGGELGARILLANTYHLFLRPGHEIIRRMGGLHRFMSWPHAILTDSGGFQVFSLSGLRKVKQDGVEFRSHLNGDAHTFTPASTVDVQLAFGSDIMMVLDECPEYPVTEVFARESMLRTARWAVQAYAHYRQRLDEWSPDAEGPVPGALFPIVQGSVYPRLRRECAERLIELDADGYAVGGLSVGEPRPLSMEAVEAVEPVLPRSRPRYAMGVGMPPELAEYVARGIDMMDCVLPTRNARNGYLFTSAGRIIIKHARYADDPRPLDEECGCHACRNYSRAYLRHLYQAGEILYSTLATEHNIAHYLRIMREMRAAILGGAFPEYLERTRAAAAEAEAPAEAG